MLATLFYTPNLFWGPPPQAIGLCTPFHAHARSRTLQCDMQCWASSYVAGQLTCTNPTWGTCLCKSKMSARSVRDLESTRVVLVLLRAICTMMCSNSLWVRHMTSAQYSCWVSGWSEPAEKARGRRWCAQSPLYASERLRAEGSLEVEHFGAGSVGKEVA